MVSRKERIAVVFDTNVFVRAFLSRSSNSASRRVVRLWLLEKRLQLVVSREMLNEYLGIFERVLNMDHDLIEKWRDRFTSDSRTTLVRLGRRFTQSRDPDDNLVLATADVGRVKYLLSNDRDLLDLPNAVKRLWKFQISTPKQFLQTWKSSG